MPAAPACSSRRRVIPVCGMILLLFSSPCWSDAVRAAKSPPFTDKTTAIDMPDSRIRDVFAESELNQWVVVENVVLPDARQEIAIMHIN
jgi:hypothetical protein